MNEAVFVGVLFGVGIALLFIRVSAVERRLSRLSRLDGKIDALLRHSGIEFDAFHDVPADVREALERGNTILAIKRFRQATGAGLKEAKEFVDEIRRRSATAVVIFVLLGAAQVLAQPAVAPSDQFFDSNGVRIRYVEQGSGPAIVLMHGYTGTLDRHFLANGVFANLAKDHRVIAFDLRGHGKSGKPHEPTAYGEEMARDVVRLLDHLKIDRAHVIGYSLGAVIAGRLATLHPDRLISVAYVAQVPFREMTSDLATFAEESVKELDGDLPFRSLAVALQPPGSKPPTDDELRKMVAPLVAVNDVKALAALWRGYRTLLTPDAALSAVNVPMMVLIGSEDQSAAGVPALVKAHPKIRTLIVQGAQHGGEQGVMRRPEFMSALREFLAAAP